MPARGLVLASLLVGLVLVVGAVRTAEGEDCLRPARGHLPAGTGSLADIGELALERLPWDVKIVRANLSAHRPVAIVALYLMEKDLLAISQTGAVYCLSRRDLTPKWVSTLKAPLAEVPGEGATHYTFLVKACDGAYWIHAFARRSGAEARGFPARLPFAASSGVANNAGSVFVGSFGSPRNNKTVESVNLATGDGGWGWRTRGLLWASPAMAPDGLSLIIAGEDGTVMSLPAGAIGPSKPSWSMRMTGAVTATPAVTPEHVVVGGHDGVLRCLDLGSGETIWLEGLDADLRTSPWVLGSMTKTARASGVEGAADVEVDAFTGVTFIRNRLGLWAHDLNTGKQLFVEKDGGRPVCRNENWVVTMDGQKTLRFHDKDGEYEVKGRLSLKMFDLIPTNRSDGCIYACTHDGGIVAAMPARPWK